MREKTMSMRTLGLIAALSFSGLLVACATVDQPGAADGPVAAAPTPGVGARWVYRGREGFRMPLVWEETHEITAVGTGGISVRVTLKGPGVDYERDELLSAPGVVQVGALMDIETRRFATPLMRYRYPLEKLPSGLTTNQHLRDLTFAGARQRSRDDGEGGELSARMVAQLE